VAEVLDMTSADDPRLADYRDLRDVELRKHVEAEHGLFLAEGEKVVRRAVGAGYAPRSFLMAERWLPGLADLLAGTDAPCFVVSEALAEEVTGFHVHRGALVSLARTPLPSVDDVLDGARSVLVLEDLVDHTNVGAVFRSGAAMGSDAVLLAPRCADPLYRRSMKVAMGWRSRSPSTRPHRGRGPRRRPPGPGARLGGARTLAALGGDRRRARHHPDGAGHRLPQRGGCVCGRLLRRRPALTEPRVTVSGGTARRSGSRRGRGRADRRC